MTEDASSGDAGDATTTAAGAGGTAAGAGRRAAAEAS